jgi:hypothetical protein
MADDNHPITPPPELIANWAGSMCGYYEAARWGADQELEACCADLRMVLGPDQADWLRSVRRPKPPSLKERALAALDDAVIRGDCITTSDAVPAIRRALESLPD